MRLTSKQEHGNSAARIIHVVEPGRRTTEVRVRVDVAIIDASRVGRRCRTAIAIGFAPDAG